jgi:hypothetical protein
MNKFVESALKYITNCENPGELKNLHQNALRQNEEQVASAAFLRLISIVPAEKLGTVEHDFWTMINAFEFSLSEERGRTTRLSRTRQKVARVGVVETLKDWAINNKDTEGFRMLLDRGMPELTGEAIILRHQEIFAENVRAAARTRLEKAGVDLKNRSLTSRPDTPPR